MKRTLSLLAVLASLTGCMAIVPNSVRPEIEHMSHLSQHEPFSRAGTDYGANMANIVLHWDIGQSSMTEPSPITFELAEGINFSPHWPNTNSFGDIIGPKEEFSARIAYSFRIH